MKTYKEFKYPINFDEEDDFNDPNEVLEIVGLPSGEYTEIKRILYTSEVQKLVNWSQKSGCYVYRDKDRDKVMKLIKRT